MPTKTSRKSALSLLEICCLTAIIGLLAAILIPGYTNAQTKIREIHRIQCIQSLKLIKLAKSAFAFDHGKTNGYPILFADIYGTNTYILVPPVCPKDYSEYKINPIGTNPTCPNPGHAIPPKP